MGYDDLDDGDYDDLDGGDFDLGGCDYGCGYYGGYDCYGDYDYDDYDDYDDYGDDQDESKVYLGYDDIHGDIGDHAYALCDDMHDYHIGDLHAKYTAHPWVYALFIYL